MKCLTPADVTALAARLEQSSADGDTDEWRALHAELSAQPAHLSIPIGELYNPDVAGFVWHLRGQALAWATDDGGNIEKQGIEPMTTIAVSLLDAVLFAMAAGVRRVSITA